MGKISHNVKYGLRKVLETADKGLKWAQDNPEVAERIVLVAATAFMARSAYKRFSVPVLMKGPLPNAYTAAVVNGYETETGAPVEILRSINPDPYYEVNDAAYVANLEVRDIDIMEMNQGNLLGMIFNVKDVAGTTNTPLAVMPYQRFMDHVKDGFPIHYGARALLAENKYSHYIPISDEDLGIAS